MVPPFTGLYHARAGGALAIFLQPAAEHVRARAPCCSSIRGRHVIVKMPRDDAGKILIAGNEPDALY
jgi:hypothetical protein